MGVGSGRGRRSPRGRARAGSPPEDVPAAGRSCCLEDERLRLECLSSTEEAARSEGFRVVAGVDEVGRGCLAGPVYAAVVVLGDARPPNGLDDSKLLEADVREALARRILATAKGCALGAATPAEIDGLGIVGAVFLAMRRALLALEASGVLPDLLLVDAFRIPGLLMPQRGVLHGDRKCTAIAAASIVAKVTRDRLMRRLDALYPAYGFAQHVGYITPGHSAVVRARGPSAVHRLSFQALCYESAVEAVA